jgi:hypothetical protein
MIPDNDPAIQLNSFHPTMSRERMSGEDEQNKFWETVTEKEKDENFPKIVNRASQWQPSSLPDYEVPD